MEKTFGEGERVVTVRGTVTCVRLPDYESRRRPRTASVEVQQDGQEEYEPHRFIVPEDTAKKILVGTRVGVEIVVLASES